MNAAPWDVMILVQVRHGRQRAIVAQRETFGHLGRRTGLVTGDPQE